jgi:hypothetical protein
VLRLTLHFAAGNHAKAVTVALVWIQSGTSPGVDINSHELTTVAEGAGLGSLGVELPTQLDERDREHIRDLLYMGTQH